MKAKKIFALSLLCLITAFVISCVAVSFKVRSQINDLFRLNKLLQEDGYYMADFEFQLLGVAYLLDKGEYLKALGRLNDYHHKLENRHGLVKIPKFSSAQEEIDFYLSLQDPKTGSFMDSSAPFCTYYSVTENILDHIDALSGSSSTGISLRYPLYFLDKINTPDKLKAYLDDVSYVGWLGSRFPQTSFHFARDLFSNIMPDNVIVRNGLYNFSPEWTHTLLEWMYDFQDPDTGLWGPKDKNSLKLRKDDVSNTYSIVKKYRNCNSEDIHPQFPLRYEEKLFNSVLSQLSHPMPDVDDLSAIHEYNLEQAKGIKLLLTRLWKNSSALNKAAAQKIIEDFVVTSFANYYVEDEGAFSYYPHAEHATVDGMSNMILDTIGALSLEHQTLYWGAPANNAQDLCTLTVHEITPETLEPLRDIPEINAWRIYRVPPDFNALQEKVCLLYYPRNTKVLDITELIPNIVHWAETTSLSTGNWKSIADIRNHYIPLAIEKTPVFHQVFPFTETNSILKESKSIYIVGFDVLQIPRFKIKYFLSDS